ncbi:hypothetical protein EG860_11610 [Enterococcus faecalis]|nr:hypothetical protein EG860_11610 [Enterococcus faecalis]
MMYQAIVKNSRTTYMTGMTAAEVFRKLLESFPNRDVNSQIYPEPLIIRKEHCEICWNERIEPDHNYCGICGTALKKTNKDGHPS